MVKALLGLLVAVAATIAAANFAFNATADTGSEPKNEPWSQNRMEFMTWNGEKWTAWIHDDRFELVPVNEDNWHRHSNTSIAFIDWDGDTWQAKIDGDGFLLAHRGEWHEETQSASGIRYRDWAGKSQLRTVAQFTR